MIMIVLWEIEHTFHSIPNRFHRAPNHRQNEATKLDLADSFLAYGPRPVHYD